MTVPESGRNEATRYRSPPLGKTAIRRLSRVRTTKRADLVSAFKELGAALEEPLSKKKNENILFRASVTIVKAFYYYNFLYFFLLRNTSRRD